MRGQFFLGRHAQEVGLYAAGRFIQRERNR